MPWTGLKGNPLVTIQGPPTSAGRGGAISFTLGDVHAHDLATILDQQGVSVRAGHHCAKPLMRALGVPATARASFSVYSTKEDVDALLAGTRNRRPVVWYLTMALKSSIAR